MLFDNNLKKLWGLHPMQDAFFNTLKETNSLLVPARIIFSSHEHYKVLILGFEDAKFAKVRGHFYHNNEELPAVGDWVAIEFSPGDHEFLPIEATLPRTSSLKRQDDQRGYQTLVANVDYIALVTSFNQDLNERRLERGLAMIEESRARPLIILNKSDLVTEDVREKHVKELSQRFSGVDIFACSSQNQSGVESIANIFAQGQSVAFLGMSGVGKSTLINAVLGVEALSTQDIRQSDSRGRHTTTHREVFLTKKGFWIVDNPGIRAFSFWGEEGVLERTFDDIADLMSSCRFNDCAHNGEPGCKVGEALENGTLSESRWENYLKIKREMEFHANKNNKLYHSQKRKEYAKRNTDLRQRLKEKGRK